MDSQELFSRSGRLAFLLSDLFCSTQDLLNVLSRGPAGDRLACLLPGESAPLATSARKAARALIAAGEANHVFFEWLVELYPKRVDDIRGVGEFYSRQAGPEKQYIGEVQPLERGFWSALDFLVSTATTSLSLLLPQLTVSDASIAVRLLGPRARRDSVHVRILAGRTSVDTRGLFSLSTTTNVDVLVHDGVEDGDLRYARADAEHVALESFFRRSGGAWTSRGCLLVQSSVHSSILDEWFTSLWFSREAQTPLQHLVELCGTELREQDVDVLVKTLGVERDIVDAAKRLACCRKPLRGSCLIFYGVSASGKSCLMHGLSLRYEARGLVLRDLLTYYIFRDRPKTESEWLAVVRELYKDVVRHCANAHYDMIELAPDCPAQGFVDILQSVRASGREPVLIVLTVTRAIADHRQRERARQVDAATVRKHWVEFETNAVQTLARLLDVETVELDTSMCEPAVSLMDLSEELMRRGLLSLL